MHFLNTVKHIETTYFKCLVQLVNYAMPSQACTSPPQLSALPFINYPQMPVFHFIFPLGFLILAYLFLCIKVTLPLSFQTLWFSFHLILFPSEEHARQSPQNYKASPKSPGIKPKCSPDRNLFFIFASISCQIHLCHPKRTLSYF